MRLMDDDRVKLAREIIAGRRDRSVEDLFSLAQSLCDRNDLGHARRIYAILLGLLSAQPRAGLRTEVEIKLALTTYKDPDLPLDGRLSEAEAMLLALLDGAAPAPAERQEILGILGGIHKRRWQARGQREHLEKALRYYRAGSELGIEPDRGYAALNAAFVLDLLAGAGSVSRKQPDSGAGHRFPWLADADDEERPSAPLRREAAVIRARVADTLAEMARKDPALAGQWRFACSLCEACLGLRRYSEARAAIARAAARRPENWRLESTARQIAEIVRLRAEEDEIPFERIAEAPGFAVLRDLLGGGAAAAATFSLGKVGLALSGGGFRASLFHIGVLARLAELDMLRHVEVVSCVSGGSLVGVYYYLELQRLLEAKPDGEISRQDYLNVVKNVEAGFLAGAQRNLRTRMLLEPGSNWKALARGASTTERMADLYERELYSRIDGEKCDARGRCIQDLLIAPAGTPAGERFDPRYDNWRRGHKVPILILNATTLNTGHNWQFTATFMGEPPARGADGRIDGNGRLRRMYYDDAPPAFRRLRLGLAVAASACVPGLFDPLALDRLYEGGHLTELVDGGLFDNQGVSGLLEQDCTVPLVSDAGGEIGAKKRPDAAAVGVALRSVSVLQTRCRQEQYRLLDALQQAGLLRGFAYVHLNQDLGAGPVDWLGCPDPSTPAPKRVLTTYGIRRDVQTALAGIRTDLDAFSDVEADALMLSGYRMTAERFHSGFAGFPIASGTAGWRFRSIEKLACEAAASPDLDLLMKALDVARYRTFKALRVSAKPWILVGIALAPALAGVWRLLPARVALPALAAAALAAGLAKWLLRHVFRNPNPLWQLLLALPMLVLGAPLTFIATRILDPIYIRFGPNYRQEAVSFQLSAFSQTPSPPKAAKADG